MRNVEWTYKYLLYNKDKKEVKGSQFKNID